jgi:hypothetical protein
LGQALFETFQLIDEAAAYSTETCQSHKSLWLDHIYMATIPITAMSTLLGFDIFTGFWDTVAS